LLPAIDQPAIGLAHLSCITARHRIKLRAARAIVFRFPAVCCGGGGGGFRKEIQRRRDVSSPRPGNDRLGVSLAAAVLTTNKYAWVVPSCNPVIRAKRITRYPAVI